PIAGLRAIPRHLSVNATSPAALRLTPPTCRWSRSASPPLNEVAASSKELETLGRHFSFARRLSRRSHISRPGSQRGAGTCRAALKPWRGLRLGSILPPCRVDSAPQDRRN